MDYVDQATALASNLIADRDGATYIGVDYGSQATTNGRQSIRLTSKDTFQHRLIILDLAHMPGGICGTWPALYGVLPFIA